MAALAGALQAGLVQLVLVPNWYYPDSAVWYKYLAQLSVRCPQCSCTCVQPHLLFYNFKVNFKI